jgi:hypothetical protein
MTEIMSGLFIGDERYAMAPDVLEYDCVINVTSEVPFSKLLLPQTSRLQVDVLDVGGQRQQEVMHASFQKCCSHIEANLRNGKRVLVHCAEGKQRSCAITVSYLMYIGMDYEAAKELLTRHHKQAFDYGEHCHFHDALSAWKEHAIKWPNRYGQ